MLKNYFLPVVFSVVSLYATTSYGQDEYTETLQYHYSHAQFDSCIQLINNLLPKYKKDLPQRIKLLNLLGKSYVRNYQYDEGQEAYTKAAELNKGSINDLISKDDYIASLLGVCDVYAADYRSDLMEPIISELKLFLSDMLGSTYYGHYLFILGKYYRPNNRPLAQKLYRQSISYIPKWNELSVIARLSLANLYIWAGNDSSFFC
ncbi:hypothetical protein LVD17_13700 [Fulvivirga ulvae]|uniref:tetratricopeptide repeat protein n=1 Tax=Fulvivirga ulvae TaxID=2904245 RepID=UPI001F1F4404|nr:hypothetical protein [Fulvivirga ulvae]UII34861.1 hypothetical protein LVD17_13700 [Fulvivirga ulvae]